MKKYFTSEAVTEGHPDKVCDQISDAVLDAVLAQDPDSRCACETTAEPGAVHIMGEITTKAKVNYEDIARATIRRIGYTKPEYGFDADSCKITCSIHEQSPDIAMGVSKDDQGAGDQGMMFGYACTETDSLMPLPVTLAQKLVKRLTQVRKDGTLSYLRPDGKAQVTVEYEDDKPVRVEAVVVSAQHDEDVSEETLRGDIYEKVIAPSIDTSLLDAATKIYINPTGRFVLGGPAADTGLTGRKIICDTYGGYARHGGGAFSGKDPSKVDRSAAYMARNIAKTIVASGAADRCEVQLSYAIGVSQPVSLLVETFGTGRVPDSDLCAWASESFDLSPKGIITKLDLKHQKYSEVAAYCHFGNESYIWEKPDEKALAKLTALCAAAVK